MIVYASHDLPNEIEMAIMPSKSPVWFYNDVDGVREIGITGVLVPNGDEVSGQIGYDWILDAISEADRVRLFIDSPGGVVHPALERIMRRLQNIDSEAIVTGMCASAAYFIGRSCKRLICDGYTTEVGGIGAYILVWDFSESNRQKGYKPIKVKIGDMKGIGAGGEYSELDVKELERYLRDIFDEYMNVLGRPIPENLIDGRVYTARKALELGLIDGLMPGVYTEGYEMNEVDDTIVSGQEESEVKSEESVENVEMASEAQVVENVVAESSAHVEEESAKQKASSPEKLPIKRVSDDFSAEKLFYKLVSVHGSRTAAWAALERINPEAYVKLRNKINL